MRGSEGSNGRSATFDLNALPEMEGPAIWTVDCAVREPTEVAGGILSTCKPESLSVEASGKKNSNSDTAILKGLKEVAPEKDSRKQTEYSPVGPSGQRKRSREFVEEPEIHGDSSIRFGCFGIKPKRQVQADIIARTKGKLVDMNKSSNELKSASNNHVYSEELQGVASSIQFYKSQETISNLREEDWQARNVALLTTGLHGQSSKFLDEPHGSFMEEDNEIPSCEVFLENCDKETRGWLVSKQNARYLFEDFGVRIALFEEIDVECTQDHINLEAIQGPIKAGYKVTLAIKQKSTSIFEEAKWFLNQASDMITALATRGVLAKRVWYKGPSMQQHSSGKISWIGEIMRRITGVSRINLESIEQENRVIISIDIVRDTKEAATIDVVPMLCVRVKGIRYKDFLQAAKQVEDLLSRVAKQASEDVRIENPGDIHIDETEKEKAHLSNCSKMGPESNTVNKTPEQVDLFEALSPVSFNASVSLPSPSACREANSKSTCQDESSEGLNSSLIMKQGAENLSDHETAQKEYQASSCCPGGESTSLNGAKSTAGQKHEPLMLTRLMRNVSVDSLRKLFENVIKRYIRITPTNSTDEKIDLCIELFSIQGYALVYLETQDLVSSILELHYRRPDVFHHMKMAWGSTSLGQFEQEQNKSAVKRLGFDHLDQKVASKSSRGKDPSCKSARDYKKREDQVQKQVVSIITVKHTRRLPERTVYVDNLPDNLSTPVAIRGIFEQILKAHFPGGELKALHEGQHIIRDVRYLPFKFCAFVEFISEELSNLALQLYREHKEMFNSMRLRPHFPCRNLY